MLPTMNHRFQTVAALSVAGVLAGHAQSFLVSNPSFEAPTVNPIFQVSNVIDGWTKNPLPDLLSGSLTPTQWDQSSGLFPNAPVGNGRHITNADGSQVAYFFALQGNGATQVLGDTFQAGMSYTVTVGLRGSIPLEPGNQFQVGLFYVDGGTATTLASTTVVSTADFQTTSVLFDASASTASLADSDAAIGHNIGIFLTAATFNPTPGISYWEVDNVRLTAVPEPMESAAFAASALLAFAVWRRRSSR